MSDASIEELRRELLAVTKRRDAVLAELLAVTKRRDAVFAELLRRELISLLDDARADLREGVSAEAVKRVLARTLERLRTK